MCLISLSKEMNLSLKYPYHADPKPLRKESQAYETATVPVFH
jgi:hypothetical protein